MSKVNWNKVFIRSIYVLVSIISIVVFVVASLASRQSQDKLKNWQDESWLAAKAEAEGPDSLYANPRTIKNAVQTHSRDVSVFEAMKGIAFLSAVAPWILHFVIRWIMRGFLHKGGRESD